MTKSARDIVETTLIDICAYLNIPMDEKELPLCREALLSMQRERAFRN